MSTPQRGRSCPSERTNTSFTVHCVNATARRRRGAANESRPSLTASVARSSFRGVWSSSQVAFLDVCLSPTPSDHGQADFSCFIRWFVGCTPVCFAWPLAPRHRDGVMSTNLGCVVHYSRFRAYDVRLAVSVQDLQRSSLCRVFVPSQ